MEIISTIKKFQGLPQSSLIKGVIDEFPILRNNHDHANHCSRKDSSTSSQSRAINKTTRILTHERTQWWVPIHEEWPWPLGTFIDQKVSQKWNTSYPSMGIISTIKGCQGIPKSSLVKGVIDEFPIVRNNHYHANRCSRKDSTTSSQYRAINKTTWIIIHKRTHRWVPNHEI